MAGRERRGWACGMEPLESRFALAIAANQIPESIHGQLFGTALNPVVQTAFAPGVSTLAAVTQASKLGVRASYYEFSLAQSSTTASGVASFSTRVDGLFVDTALALYDADGNLLQSVDADDPTYGVERLTVKLDLAKPYVLGVFARNDDVASAGGDPFTISVDTGDQRVNSTIKVDPVTGTASFLATSGADRFQGPADVNYFPLRLTNLGQQAAITLEPAPGADTRLYAELYRRGDSRDAWTPIASGLSNAATGVVTLVPQAAAGGSLTDSEFLLAVSPKSLQTPPHGYKVSIAGGQPLLVPAKVSPAGLPGLGALVPTSPGVTGATVVGSKPLPAAFVVRATLDGRLDLEVGNPGFKPLLSVYDASGQKLLAVASRTTAGLLATSIQARAGKQYVVRVGTLSNVKSGSFQLTASQGYVPTELSVGAAGAGQTKLNLDPAAGGSFVRVVPAAGADILVLRLAASAGATASPRLSVLSPSSPQGPAVTVAPQAGQKTIDYAIDLSKSPGPFDLFITGVGGVGLADLSCMTATLPRSLAVGSFATASLDLKSGGFATAPSKSNVAFGKLGGTVSFYEPSPGVKESISAAGGGPTAILEYVQQGNTFTLKDWTMRTDGVAPTLVDFVPGRQLVGVAGMSLSLGGTPGLAVSVAGPKQRAGVGVAMVPDLITPTKAVMRIRNQYLETPAQRDFWQTILPGNVLGNQANQLKFEPLTPGQPLQVKVSVLNAAADVLWSGTSKAGQPLVTSLSAAILNQNKGAPLKFLVEPVAGSQVGEGGYNLSLTVTTTDSRPFGLTESSFLPAQLGKPVAQPVPDGNGNFEQGQFPSWLKIVPVGFGGTVKASLTSAQPYSTGTYGDTGSIDVFSVQMPLDPQTKKPIDQPFEIFTTDDAGSNVNTAIALYAARYKLVGNTVTNAIDRYDRLDGTSPSFDYYGADRSVVDAKVVINNPAAVVAQFDGVDGQSQHAFYANGNYTLYVVVKNEYATKGDYTLHVAPITPQNAGPRPAGEPAPILPAVSTTFIDPVSGTASGGGAGVAFSTPSTLDYGAPIAVSIATSNALVLGGQVFVDVYDSKNVLRYTQSVTAFSNTLSLSLDDDSFPFQPSSGYIVRVRGQAALDVDAIDFQAEVSPGSPVSVATEQFATRLSGDWSTVQPYERLAPTPDGRVHGAISIHEGSLVVQQRSVFSVEAAGPASFTIADTGMSSGSWALYRLDPHGVNEEDVVVGTLVDFVRPAAVGAVSFTDYVQPGAYELRLWGNALADSSAATFDLQLPAFDARDITVDPNTGNNQPLPLLVREPEVSAGVSPHFLATDYLHFAAPADAAKGWTLDLRYVAPMAAETVQDDTFRIFKRNAFTDLGANGDQYIPVPVKLSDKITVQVGGVELAGGFHLTIDDQPLPGDEYFVGHFGFLHPASYLVGPAFTVPQSGDADLVVKRISFSPDSGQTFVDVEIANIGNALAIDYKGVRELSNYKGYGGSPISFSALGAFGSTHYKFPWHPDDPADFVRFVVNQPDVIGELRTDNNEQKKLLSSVDPHRPTASIALDDAALDGEAGASVWGRYLSGVLGVPLNFKVTGADVDKDYYTTVVDGLYSDQFTGINGTAISSHVIPFQKDAGKLFATAADNPNEIHYEVIDQYGLRTGDLVQRIDVVPKPSFWRDNTGPAVKDAMSWNAAKHGYDIGVNYNIVNYDETVSDLLNTTVPFIGDKHNTFTINVSGAGFASLDPEAGIAMPVTLSLLLRAVGEDIFNEQYAGKQQISKNLTVEVAPIVDGHTVEVTGGSVSLQLRDYDIAHYKSPKIPVYSLGVPGVASFDIDLGFGVDVTLDAGVKLGIDKDLNVGLMSPTFLQPHVTPYASISGDVEVLSFPIAGITGKIGLEITLTAGLKNKDYAKIFSLDDFVNNLGLGISFSLDIGAEAHLVGAKVWNVDYHIPLGDPVGDASQILTTDVGEAPSNASAVAKLFAALGNPASLLSGGLPVPAGVKGSPTPVISGGTAVVQDDLFQATPQMVIDPQSGDGLLVQLVQVDSSDPGKKGILQVASRTGSGAWSEPTDLPSADVSNPVLAFTGDGAGKRAAVVVYEGLSGYDGPSGRQLNDVLARHDLKYRYYDGSAWGVEQPLTPADGRYDSQTAVAFNDSGRGVVAWVHNTSAVAFDANGSYTRNAQDIQAAVWNPATHAWSAPLAISQANDGVADIKPASFVDASGNAYVVWIRGDAASNTLYFSRYDGKTWSAPAAVGIDGMTPGSFGEIALGADDLGRIDLLFTHRVQNADGTIDSRLYNRSTLPSAFGQSAGYEQVSQTFAGYSHLRTTTAPGPNGGLVAYWQQSDGVNDGVFATQLSRSQGNVRGTWSAPAKITATKDVTRTPSLAVDVDGRMQTFYAIDKLPDFGPAVSLGTPSVLPAVAAPAVQGVGSVSYVPLPELAFSSPLAFPHQPAAAAGTQAVGRATIVNTGMVGDTVTVNWYRGLPGGGTTVAGGGTLLGTKTIALGAGASYDLAVPFDVADGLQLYSVQVVGTKCEAITAADDVTTALLEGKADIVVLSVVPSVAPSLAGADAGAAKSLTATIVNVSDAAVGGFDVTLYGGDPQFPQNPVTVLDTRHVDALAAGAEATLVFPVTLPDVRGNYTFTVRADSGQAVDEAVEANNDGHFSGRFRADPAIGFDAAGKAQVTASLLNVTGVDNVEVKVVVRNDGDVAVANLPVHLTASRNGSQPATAASQTVPSLAAGASTTLTFLVAGLDGTYRYRASLDAAVNTADDDLSNNTGTASLVIHGLADLVVTPPVPSTLTPMQGWPLALTTIVGNAGIADAKGVLVEVFAQGRDGGGNVVNLKVGGTTIDVDALSNVPLSLPVDTTQLVGQFKLVVRVNRFHSVMESTELNDSASIDLTFAPKIIPQVVSLSVPSSATYLAAATLSFTATFNEPVTVVGSPVIALVVGQVARKATYVSGSGGTALVFSMTVQAGDVDVDGVTLTGLAFPAGSSIRDAVGTAALAALPATATGGVRVDAQPPQVLSIIAPAVGTYGVGKTLLFQLVFNEPALVTGIPRIGLKVGNVVRQAEYVSGSGTSLLVFRYVVQTGDNDAVGVVLSRTITLLSTATIRDAATNAAGLSLPLAKTTGVKVKT